MRWMGRVLLLTGVLWLHITMSAAAGAGGSGPDLLLVLAILAGLLQGPLAGAGYGFAAGLAGDILTGRLVGLGALSLAGSGLAAGVAARRVFRDNLAVLGAVAFVLALLSTAAHGLAAQALGVPVSVLRLVWGQGIARALYSAVLVPLAYAAARRRARPRGGVEAGTRR